MEAIEAALKVAAEALGGRVFHIGIDIDRMQVFQNNLSFRRVAWQDQVMVANGDVLAAMVPQLELLLPELDEKGRRLALGAVARAAGDGSIGAVRG